MSRKLIFYSQVLGISVLANTLLLFARNWVVGNQLYDYLLWNLFLGLIPFLCVALIVSLKDRLPKGLFWGGLGCWLLFYPNAPYMITDLMHVCESQQILYDTIIIFSFALLACFAGFYSMDLVFDLLNPIFGKKWTYFVLYTLIVLSSFGIYLGRILRLNSWDIFSKPIQTMQLILEHLFPVSKNPTTYTILLLFSFLQIMLFALIVQVRRSKTV